MRSSMQLSIQKINSFTFLKTICFIVITLLSILDAKAQSTVSVNGTIYSKIDNTPLPGASIVLKNSIRGTESNINGEFDFENLKIGDKITVHFIGYANKEITVNSNKQTFNIYLEEDGELIDAVNLGAADTREHYKTKRGFFKNLFSSNN